MSNVTATFFISSDALARISRVILCDHKDLLPTKRPPCGWILKQNFPVMLLDDHTFCIVCSCSWKDRKQTSICMGQFLRRAREKNKCPHLYFDRATSWAKILIFTNQEYSPWKIPCRIHKSNCCPSNRFPQTKIRLTERIQAKHGVVSLYVGILFEVFISDVPSIATAILLSISFEPFQQW